MRFNIRRTLPPSRFPLPALFALLTIAAACGYDSTSPYPSIPPGPSAQNGLWTASGSNPAILRLSPGQLLTTGDLVPATEISTPSAQLFDLNGIAFDTDGTMWVTSGDDSRLVAFAPATLTGSGSRAATYVITSTATNSLSGPTSLAFDAQHRLWVANAANGTIVRFDRAQLATSGAPTPAVIISGLAIRPTSLAFDAAGSLWVSDSRLHTISKYTAAQLAASGSPAPQVVLSEPANTVAKPAGIAFDAAGNLWVAFTNSETIGAFSPAQLAASGSPVPSIVLSSNAGSLSIPVGVAFDDDGSLWVIGGGGALTKFASASLGATGAPAPSAKLNLTTHTQFWSVAFWPKPTRLPLN